MQAWSESVFAHGSWYLKLPNIIVTSSWNNKWVFHLSWLWETLIWSQLRAMVLCLSGKRSLEKMQSVGGRQFWTKVIWIDTNGQKKAILSQSHLTGCKWSDEGNFQRKTYFAGELAPSLQRPVSSGFLPSGQCWSGLSAKKCNNSIYTFL